MNQINPRPGSPVRARLPAGIVGASVTAGAAAHVLAALAGPAGAMAWWMAAMGAACLACAAPLARRKCAGRAAGHLLAMSAAMILIHLILLAAPGAAGHHGATAPGAVPDHAGSMLAVIAVELVCLIGASAALRLHLNRQPQTTFHTQNHA